MKSSSALPLAAHSGNVIPAQKVHLVKPPAPKSDGPHLASICRKEPKINVIKDGESVRAIEVICTCGEVIRLDCMY